MLPDLSKLKQVEHPELLLAQAEPFLELMMKYHCAIMEVETKIKILNEEFSHKNQRNPIESIKTRIKSPASILEKMNRRDIPFDIEHMEKELNDIAGVRVICSFPEDIYDVARLITEQDDIVILQIKDYIENPKSNGYRSLHLIVAIPIFLSSQKKNMKVELQFRTIAMDFWASLEHKMKYKKDIEDAETISDDLKFSADLINQLDRRMQQIRERIDESRAQDVIESACQRNELSELENLVINTDTLANAADMVSKVLEEPDNDPTEPKSVKAETDGASEKEEKEKTKEKKKVKKKVQN